jgi:hypothetical protein
MQADWGFSCLDQVKHAKSQGKTSSRKGGREGTGGKKPFPLYSQGGFVKAPLTQNPPYSNRFNEA